MDPRRIGASVAGDLTYVYGVQTGCRSEPAAPSAPADVVNAFIAGVTLLENVCDAQNAAAAAAGRPACPPSTCLATFEPGGTEPPKLEVEITWSNNTSSSVSGMPVSRYVSSGASLASGTISGGTFLAGGSPSGSGGSSGGSSSSGGGFGPGGLSGAGGSNSSSEGIVVRVKLTTTLGRQPDKLVCVNPMSQTSRDGLLAKVIDLASRGGADCGAKP